MFNIYRKFFSFEKVSNGQSHSSSGSHHPIRKFSLSKISDSPQPLTLFGKPCSVSSFQQGKGNSCKCSFNFWNVSFPAHRILHCDKVETSSEENHYHLGHKLKCTLPLIQDISQVLWTHRSTTSNTTNATTHLLGCNCIQEKKQN